MLHGHRAGAPLLGALALALTAAACTAPAPDAAASPSATATTTPSATPTVTAAPGATPQPGATGDPGSAPGATATPPVSGDGRAVVELVVSYAGWQASAVEVAGFVPVVESDGVCRLVLTSAGGEVAVEQAATPDASTTSCGWLSVPGTDLSPGTWSAVLSYSSGASVASSAPVPVEVP